MATDTAARRPPGWVACSVHGVIGSAPTLTERSRLLARHYDTVDRGRTDTVTQLPGVSFTETFILAVRALPVGWTGTTADLHALVPPATVAELLGRCDVSGSASGAVAGDRPSGVGAAVNEEVAGSPLGASRVERNGGMTTEKPASATDGFPPNRRDIHSLSECMGGGCQAVHIDSLGWPIDAESAAMGRLTRHTSGEWVCAHGRYYLCCDEPTCPYRNERVRGD